MAVNYVSRQLSALLLKYIRKQQLDVPCLKAELLNLDNEKPLKYSQWCLYLHQLVEATSDPSVGIKLGQMVDPNHYGVIGHLASSCENVAEALSYFERYQKLLYGGDKSLALIQSVDDTIKFEWPAPSSKIYRGTYDSDDALISGLGHFIRIMCGDMDLAPLEIAFRRPAPESESQQLLTYQQTFDCPIIFDQPRVHVVVDINHLQIKVGSYNSALKSLLETQAQTLMGVLPSNDKFEVAIKKQLIKSMQEGKPSLEEVAAQTNTSPRTLHRKLEEKGTNFKKLLEESRKELAIQYLAENKMSMSEISMLLGYSEQSAFSRAFKKWTGKSPKQYVKIRSV